MEESKVNLVIFGAPGSGKGTQARVVAERFGGLSVISMGDLLRDEVSCGSEIGREIEEVMSCGALVSDALVCEMLFRQVRKVGSGFLLDGFPRNVLQAQFLEVILRLLHWKIDVVIKLEVDVAVVESRLKGRILCRDCGMASNISFVEDVCGGCGGRDYVRRDDDDIETIRQRVLEYERMVGNLEMYYGNKVVKVNGNRSIDEVFGDIVSMVNYLITS